LCTGVGYHERAQSATRTRTNGKRSDHDRYLRPRLLNWGWKLFFLEPGPFRPDPDRSEAWNRGAYLVRAVSHCGECHTPRNAFGAPIDSLELAGTSEGPEGGAVPNITPDAETGIGGWSRAELLDYLRTGMTPGFDFAGGAMAEVIDESLAHLSDADLEAIVTYLESLEPVRREVITEAPADDEDKEPWE